MSLESLVGWILCGLIVGACARFLLPGRQNMTLVMTCALGVAGAILGGFIYSTLKLGPAATFSMHQPGWPGWIVSILGAMALLWAYAAIYPRRWWQ